ncbi:MAG: PIN domain-containing protein [Candidatus Bipolaricaulota bacterium]|nr:PIN domain-containing protein [Candidatus Bipolaricaulota bacterium]
MNDKYFVDTNILVYAYNADEKEKHAQAAALLQELWDRKTGVLSLQVLQEFYVTVTQKIEKPISSQQARKIVADSIAAWEIVEPTTETLLLAIEIRDKYQLHFWDAMIFAAAREAGAKVVYTEDFQHGREIEGIRFVNPFVKARR